MPYVKRNVKTYNSERKIPLNNVIIFSHRHTEKDNINAIEKKNLINYLKNLRKTFFTIFIYRTADALNNKEYLNNNNTIYIIYFFFRPMSPLKISESSFERAKKSNLSFHKGISPQALSTYYTFTFQGLMITIGL